MNGLCFWAYRLTVVEPIVGAYSTWEPVLGRFSMCAFQLSPLFSSWSTMVWPENICGVAAALAACSGVSCR